MSTRDQAPLPPAPESAAGFLYSSSQTLNFAEDSRAYTAGQARHGSSGYAYSQVNIIEIPLAPGQFYLDVSSSHLFITLTVTPGTGAIGTSLSKIGTAGLFRTVTLRVQGGAEVIRMAYYNRMHALMSKFYAPGWMHTAGRRYGYGSKVQREADAAAAKRLEVDLSLFALFSQSFHVPLNAVGLELVLELENPINCVPCKVAGTTDPTYTINSVVLYQELISGSEGIDQIVVGALANNEPVLLPMHMYTFQPQTLAIGESVVTKAVPFYAGQVTGVSWYWVPQLDYSSAVYDVFDKTVNVGLNTVQTQVGSEYIPPQPINVLSFSGAAGAGEVLALIDNFAYKNVSPLAARYQGDHFDSGPPTGAGSNVAVRESDFFMSIPMGSGRDAARGGGLNTANPPVNININLALATALTTAMAMNIVFSSRATLQLGLTGAKLIS